MLGAAAITVAFCIVPFASQLLFLGWKNGRQLLPLFLSSVTPFCFDVLGMEEYKTQLFWHVMFVCLFGSFIHFYWRTIVAFKTGWL